jgi:hypothetical protein
LCATGEGHDLSTDIGHYLACLASFRLMHLKAENLRFFITLVELFVADMATKINYLMGAADTSNVDRCSFCALG